MQQSNFLITNANFLCYAAKVVSLKRDFLKIYLFYYPQLFAPQFSDP